MGADLLALASPIATAALLLDGISILLTTLVGMTVLAFYHPMLLAFDIRLAVAILLLVIPLSGRGVATAVDESLAKHALVRWLEQPSQPGVTFHSRSGMQLGSDVAASLTAHYLEARTSHFRIVFRQLTFGLAIQVLSLVLLLGLGGWLVINGQMTLGQLVAAALLRQRLRVEQRAGAGGHGVGRPRRQRDGAPLFSLTRRGGAAPNERPEPSRWCRRAFRRRRSEVLIKEAMPELDREAVASVCPELCSAGFSRSRVPSVAGEDRCGRRAGGLKSCFRVPLRVEFPLTAQQVPRDFVESDGKALRKRILLKPRGACGPLHIRPAHER